VVRKIFKLYGEDNPADRIPILANIILASISISTNEPLQAFFGCETVLYQLDMMEKVHNPQISNSTMKYMRYVCKHIISLTTDKVDSPAFLIARNIKIEFDNIEISKVSPKVRRMFPITAEMGEQIDQYFRNNSQ
jgi:hypothetical protein